jgi:hypothetical protein
MLMINFANGCPKLTTSIPTESEMLPFDKLRAHLDKLKAQQRTAHSSRTPLAG